MNSCLHCLTGLLFLPLSLARAEEPLDVAKEFQEIAADYQLVAAANTHSQVRAAAARLTRRAYRSLVDRAGDRTGITEDDRYALGQCHEALGESAQAEERYRQSMASQASVRGHLALARLASSTDPVAAERHFLEAQKLDAKDPRLAPFQLLLGAAYQRQRVWDKAIEHLRGYEKHVVALTEEKPTVIGLIAKRDAIARRLQDLKTYESLIGKPVPQYAVLTRIQGDPVDLEDLRGQVVLVDFFAVWAGASRARMEELKKLKADHPDQPLTILGLALSVDGRVPASQRADLENTQTYARRAEISWPLAYVGRDTTDRYGVSTLPHTLVIDKQGDLRLIIQEGTKGNLEELKKTVSQLLE